jgi:hypothetical protein
VLGPATVWGMLRNPAYAGRAGFGKTARSHDDRPALNRTGRLAGKARSTNPTTRERDRNEWIEVAVPAIIDEDTFELAARRIADNKRFATRNSTTPSLLRGLVACQSCSYAYYRTSTRTTRRKIAYYCCIGSDAWRHASGKICDARPVRADQLEPAVWQHVTGLLTDPTLIRNKLDRRLAQLRAANPATAQRTRLERDLARATNGITRLLQAYQEQLLSLDELRERMPKLRKREAAIRLSSTRWTPNSSTTPPTSSSPRTSKASCPGYARASTAQASRTVGVCCAPSSAKSSSAPTASSSATASLSASLLQPLIATCAGGVISPVLAKPAGPPLYAMIITVMRCSMPNSRSASWANVWQKRWGWTWPMPASKE